MFQDIGARRVPKGENASKGRRASSKGMQSHATTTIQDMFRGRWEPDGPNTSARSTLYGICLRRPLPSFTLLKKPFKVLTLSARAKKKKHHADTAYDMQRDFGWNVTVAVAATSCSTLIWASLLLLGTSICPSRNTFERNLGHQSGQS